MRYWWVNQNQTFEHEFRGGYIWSPKRNKNGARNQYYENMREVAPGDVVFSFRNRRIVAIAVANSFCYESPKPPEFASAGPNWDRIGWRVDVTYRTPEKQIMPRDHMALLRPLLPSKYAPLQANGDGIQSVYLAELERPFAEVLAGLIGLEAQELISVVGDPMQAVTMQGQTKGIDEWENHLEATLLTTASIDETERQALITARRGQGAFKQNVMHVEKACRITKVDNPVHLVGSHIKPWRDSSNAERLDGENGLLLTPSIDHLFDRGFISFDGDGSVLISPRADTVSLGRMGIPAGPPNVGAFTRQQRLFLEYHRDLIFLRSKRA